MIFRLSTMLLLVLLPLPVWAQDAPRQAAEKAMAAAERLEKALWVAGNGDKSLAEYEKAWHIWRALGDQKQEARTLLRLTTLRLTLTGNAPEIKQTALQLAETFQALGDAEGEALALNIVAWHEGYNAGVAANQKYQQLFDQALAKARQAATRYAEMLVLASYALALSSNGEYEKALAWLDQAGPLARALPDLRQEANVNFTYGLTYWRIGAYEKALAHYEEAHRLFKEDGERGWATTAVENAALVYHQLEQPAKVLESYREALPFRRETGNNTAVADNLTSIAAALVQLKRPQAALQQVGEAMEIYERTKNPWGVAWAWRILGEAHLAQGDYDQAATFLENSRRLQAELNEQNGVAKATYLLAKTRLAQGRLEEARQHVEELLATLESQRANLNSPDLRLAFFSARRAYYELYLAILWQLHSGNPKAGHELLALEAGERARARNLFELLSAKINAPVANAPEIQNLLDNDTALLAFTVGKDGSFLVAVTSQQVSFYKLPGAEVLEPLVQEVRLALSEAGRRNYARFVVAAQRLYQVLLKPAESVLQTKQNLLIAPDAALNYLPFEVLLTADPLRTGSADFHKLPFALRRWTISYTPSASVLAEVRKKKQSAAGRSSRQEQSAVRSQSAVGSQRGQSAGAASSHSAIQTPQSASVTFVAFADPLYNHGTTLAPDRVRRFAGDAVTSRAFARLAEAGREANDIAAGFGAAARVFSRQSATERNVKQSAELSQARILHFATHGLVNERLPQLSGLLLTADETEDGFLQTDEIYDLNLSADLVVLSACSTALGKHLRGEGVLGLTRAFFRAGAASVAATLWQVEDKTTADLMIDFYAHLKTSPRKASALRQAKLNILNGERLAHPHFWASFVLIGEP